MKKIEIDGEKFLELDDIDLDQVVQWAIGEIANCHVSGDNAFCMGIEVEAKSRGIEITGDEKVILNLDQDRDKETGYDEIRHKKMLRLASL